MAQHTYTIQGMDCADCARHIEQGVSQLNGIHSAKVHLTTGLLLVEGETPASTIRRRVEALGYRLVEDAPRTREAQNARPERLLPGFIHFLFSQTETRLALAGGLLLILSLALSGVPRAVLQVLALLVAVYPVARSGLANAHLVVIGDGPGQDEIRRSASELGIAGRVHLLGVVSEEDKYRALSIADVFVSASQHEGFGLVFLEALASGLPVVCYDQGGHVDFLATGETGYMVKLNDTAAFAAALQALAGSQERRREIGAANRRKAEGFFIERCAERYEAILEQSIARHAAR